MIESSESMVALYKYVHYAAEPVSLEQIIEHALPPQMRSHAYQQWTEEQAAQGVTIVDEHWDVQSNKDLAWRWWVTRLVRSACNTKRLSIASTSGKRPNQHTPEDQRLYVPGMHAPTVKHPDGKMRPWTPELDRDYERAVAGMRVTQRADDVLKSLASWPDKSARDAAAALIRDAVTAIKP